jgi:hypothetical protein
MNNSCLYIYIYIYKWGLKRNCVDFLVPRINFQSCQTSFLCCAYIYIYLYIHINIYVYVCIFIYIPTIYIDIYVYIYIYIPTRDPSIEIFEIGLFKLSHTCNLTKSRIFQYIYIYMYIYIYIHIYIYIYIYIPVI